VVIGAVEMKSTLKPDNTVVPLHLRKEWRDFFDEMACNLNITRNAVMNMALKFGGPMVEHMYLAGAQQLERAIGVRLPCTKTSRNLQSDPIMENALEPKHDRRQQEPNTTTSSRPRTKT
jgi:hypothetical protein